MALVRAWLVLFLIWAACAGLTFWVRSMSRQHAFAWLRLARWLALGAAMALGLAALIIYLF
ncbi:hypothetical protein OU995_11385 [Roseateles sp. SL47]|uniref:hypothetical protein n=1 Tax=Roseateles sp. SL47 TaxID=2995138 RepID=UPI002271F674|nr:hypothetical protein [Roseateles sp. SL47]WAC75258.1 hypothetical protein OU995_11385 [Roseateles sp. SL47]